MKNLLKIEGNADKHINQNQILNVEDKTEKKENGDINEIISKKELDVHINSKFQELMREYHAQTNEKINCGLKISDHFKEWIIKNSSIEEKEYFLEYCNHFEEIMKRILEGNILLSDKNLSGIAKYFENEFNISISSATVRYHAKKILPSKEYRERFSVHNRASLNENYFNKIDNKEKAYWLGFLYADGFLYAKQNRLGIGIDKSDESLIDRFLRSIDADGVKKIYRKNSNMVEIYIGNKKLAADLLQQGVVPRKSKIIEFPKLNSRDLELAFLLGYFDGDGSKGTTRITTGSKKFLEQIKRKFQIKNEIHEEERGYKFHLGSELFNEMMDNYEHSLSRKRKYFYTKEEQFELFFEGTLKNRGKKKFYITKEELEKLVWEKPTSQIAKEYGITGSTVAARCRRLKIPKPPRGYWAKKRSKKNRNK